MTRTLSALLLAVLLLSGCAREQNGWVDPGAFSWPLN